MLEKAKESPKKLKIVHSTHKKGSRKTESAKVDPEEISKVQVLTPRLQKLLSWKKFLFGV